MDSQRRTGSTGPLLPSDPERVGAYTILGRIGEGGMGAVYLGQGPDGRNVAVKVVRPELARDAGFVARFADEVTNARRVASFCTAQVLDHGESAGHAYMVTEFIDGVSLLEYVNENGGLSPGMVQGVAVGVAAALVAIHSAGLIHRDLKPANVLLSFSGPRVIDFGIARALDAASGHTMTGQLVGSPGWMAPEQVLAQPVTTAVDIFTWGCLVAYAANGVNPFGRGDFAVMTARLVHSEPSVGVLPSPLDRLVSAALDKNPDNRPTARELLLTLVGGESTEAAVLGTLTPSWQPPAAVPPPVSPQAHAAAPPPAPALSPVPPPAPAPGWSPAPSWSPSGGLPDSADEPTRERTSASGAATLPAGPTPEYAPEYAPTPGQPPGRPPTPSTGRPRGSGGRRAALAAAVALILAGGAVTGWLILTSGGGPAKDNASPAPLPSDPLLVRVDRAPGWPKDCHGNIGELTPGSGAVPLLLDDDTKCDVLPQWSPDHHSIAFTRASGGKYGLWVMNTDDKVASLVTDGLTGKTRVSWSPNGKQIVFMGASGTTQQIFVVTLADKEHPTQITTDGSKKDDPVWCGGRLAFWSDRSGHQEIYTTAAATAGGTWSQVTKGDHKVNDPAWSPDCKKIAYTDQPNDTDRNIWVVGADGTDPRQLTSSNNDMDANWSKRGDWIAFVRGPFAQPRVWAMRADGTDQQLLSPANQAVGHPDWN